MKDLTGLLELMRMTHEFREIERVTHMGTRDIRQENDVEHSFQLALCGWYVVVTENLPLDVNKVIKYGLLHDLVEVYAGDTYTFDQDPGVHASKKDREHQALLQLREKFPEFKDMTDMIEEYEKRDDQESTFIYALDKIIAPLNIYLSDGRTWKERNVTFEQLVANKQDKVKLDPVISEYFDKMKDIFEKDKDRLFPKP